jgi:hypothetical protein
MHTPRYIFAPLLFCAIAAASAQLPAPIRNAAGLRLLVADEDSQPVLRIVLPGQPLTDRSIEVIFPEHVTAREEAQPDQPQTLSRASGIRPTAGGEQRLYLFRPGQQAPPPIWRRTGHSLEYETDFPPGIHFLARATLENDGVLFHYEFQNHSPAAYSMIYAVTDPRLTGIFHDERLERTYVHLASGFDLLASDTPARLTLPLAQWLPARYMASYTWPVPAELVEHRSDGITYYNKSRQVDQPMIATVSQDHQWIVSSFTRTIGNVWSNPELTCQHVDPQTALAPGQHTVLEVKILVLRGSLDQALQKVIAQRQSLQ